MSSWLRSAPAGMACQKPKSMSVKPSGSAVVSRLLGQASPWAVRWGSDRTSSRYAGSSVRRGAQPVAQLGGEGRRDQRVLPDPVVVEDRDHLRVEPAEDVVGHREGVLTDPWPAPPPEGCPRAGPAGTPPARAARRPTVAARRRPSRARRRRTCRRGRRRRARAASRARRATGRPGRTGRRAARSATAPTPRRTPSSRRAHRRRTGTAPTTAPPSRRARTASAHRPRRLAAHDVATRRGDGVQVVGELLDRRAVEGRRRPGRRPAGYATIEVRVVSSTSAGPSRLRSCMRRSEDEKATLLLAHR